MSTHKVGGQLPVNTEPTPDNPLVILADNGRVHRISDKALEACHRIMGCDQTEQPVTGIQILTRFHSPVLKDNTRKRIERVTRPANIAIPKNAELPRHVVPGYEFSFTDNHHLIPTSRGGADIDKNKVLLTRGLHANFHLIFNNFTPLEQIAFYVLVFQSFLPDKFFSSMQQELYPALKNQSTQYVPGTYKKQGITY